MTSAKWPFKHGGGKRREKEKTEIVLNHQKRSSPHNFHVHQLANTACLWHSKFTPFDKQSDPISFIVKHCIFSMRFASGAASKAISDSTPIGKRKVIPPIPLTPPEPKQYSSDELTTHKLKINPNEEDSGLLELKVATFGTGSLEEWFRHEDNIVRVLTGMGATTGPEQYSLIRRMIKGSALSAFNNKATELGHATVAHAALCRQAITKALAPPRAALVQKRYLRRFVRKPITMTSREYVERIREINNFLPRFPPIVRAQNNVPVTALPDDELVDLLEFGVPSSWQKQMLLQNFDPLDSTLEDFTTFCERLENVAEETPSKPASKSSKSENPPSKKRKGSKGNPIQTPDKWCLLHGHCSHTTDGCNVLKAQAERMKQNRSNGSNHQAKKQELNALVDKAAAKAYNQVLKKNKAAKAARKAAQANVTEEELKNFEDIFFFNFE